MNVEYNQLDPLLRATGLTYTHPIDTNRHSYFYPFAFSLTNLTSTYTPSLTYTHPINTSIHGTPQALVQEIPTTLTPVSALSPATQINSCSASNPTLPLWRLLPE